MSWTYRISRHDAANSVTLDGFWEFSIPVTRARFSKYGARGCIRTYCSAALKPFFVIMLLLSLFFFGLINESLILTCC